MTSSFASPLSPLQRYSCSRRTDHSGQQRESHHRHYSHRQGFGTGRYRYSPYRLHRLRPDSDWAYATGSRLSNAIMKALTDAEIPADAIESENQYISPVPDFQLEKLSPAERGQKRFQVTQSWTVRTAADDAAKVLDLAVKAGANQSGQIDWSFKDEHAPETEPRKALKSARAQAEQMATSLKAKLGFCCSRVTRPRPNPFARWLLRA